MMTTALQPIEVVPPPTLRLLTGRRHTAETILDAWRAGKSPHTMRSYEHDLDTFGRFLSSALSIVPPLGIPWQNPCRCWTRARASSLNTDPLAVSWQPTVGLRIIGVGTRPSARSVWPRSNGDRLRQRG